MCTAGRFVWILVGGSLAIAACGGPAGSPTPTPTGSPRTTSATQPPSLSPTLAYSPALVTGWGIPTLVHGEPVLTGAAVQPQIAAAVDDTPFLVGGRVSLYGTDCYVPHDFPATPLLRACGDGFFMELGEAIDYRVRLAGDINPDDAERAVVLRVHLHDSRAAACPDRYRVRCDQAVVVEAIVWSGASFDWSEFVKPTDPPDSLRFASDPPVWSAFGLAEGAVYAYDIETCGAGESQSADLAPWLDVRDGQGVQSRSFYSSPFRNRQDAPEWLRNEDAWWRPISEGGCSAGWNVFVVSGSPVPRRIGWSGQQLDVTTVAIGQPVDVSPLPSFRPPDKAPVLAPGHPYGPGFDPWIRDASLSPAVVRGVLEGAASKISTLTGKPYWDATATFECYDALRCRLVVTGQLAGSEDVDGWLFLLRPDGSELELDRDPSSEFDGPPLRSVPLPAVEDLMSVASEDPETERRLGEYPYIFDYAAWYPDRPGVLSLTYNRPVTTAPTHAVFTITIDIAERRVIRLEEHEHGW
jgi:hypothetical protein